MAPPSSATDHPDYPEAWPLARVVWKDGSLESVIPGANRTSLTIAWKDFAGFAIEIRFTGVDGWENSLAAGAHFREGRIQPVGQGRFRFNLQDDAGGHLQVTFADARFMA
ncbi:MAG: hypothetical protein ACFE0O_00740 [Opitutales bacterium]